jgi:hypothetical protein
MIVAAIKVDWPNGFSLNWTNTLDLGHGIQIACPSPENVSHPEAVLNTRARAEFRQITPKRVCINPLL